MSSPNIGQYRQYIQDEYIWLYIFGEDRPRLNSVDSLLRCINNTVNLTFMYVLSCIRSMYKNEEGIEEKIKTFNPNARRAIKNTDRIYNGLDISFELINYILLDVQFDLSLGNASCLRQFIPGVSETFMPLDYSPLILHWMSSSSIESSITLDELILRFQKLVVSLPFLKARLYEEDSDMCFDILLGFENKKFYTDHKLFVQDCGRCYYLFYFLERVENLNHACTLHYSTPDYADKYTIVYHDEQYMRKKEEREGVVYQQMDAEDLSMLYSCITGSAQESLFQAGEDYSQGIHSIYTINYKYLKNLSLAIADELGAADNTVSREVFLAKYGISNVDDADLDSIIIMKLIEKTPTTVLYDLFYINSNSFHSIIRNLYRRFNGRIHFRRVDFSAHPTDFSALDQFILNSLHSGRRYIRQGELADLQANYIISMILSSTQRAIPIADDIGRIQVKRNLEEAQDTLARILMRCCVFYQGILACGREKLVYDAQHYDSIPTADETAETQIRLQSSFLQAAEFAYKEEFEYQFTQGCAADRMTYAIERFLALDELFDKSENERYLKCMLGRTSVFDRNQLALSIGLKDMPDEAQLRQIVSILEYLNTGAFENNEGCGDFNSSIYPVIGKYRSSSESGDQCHVACFSLRIDVNANGTTDYMRNINVLSEFTYQINEYYYCLPNISRSSSEWWIDPLIIKASDFDALFNKGG